MYQKYYYKEDTKMLKKFLSIFKRDKAGYSSEELEWQRKIGQMLKKVINLIIGISNGIIGLVVLERLKEFSDSYIVVIIAFAIIIVIASGSAVIILRIMTRAFRLREIDVQLQQNLKQEKEKQEEKILSCLEKRDFLELGIDWPMIDRLFQLCLMCGKIEIKPSSDGVEISISNSIEDIPTFSINRDQLLNYFDFDVDEK